jgi:hypothetical protein
MKRCDECDRIQGYEEDYCSCFARAEEREKILWLFRDIRENDTAVNGAAAAWAISIIHLNTPKGEEGDV